MPYVGNIPAESYAAFNVQHFTTSATTSYTLDHAVANELDIRLVINNVIQQPGSGKAYTATGTTLTLSAATSGTDTMYCVYTGKAVQTVNPPAGSVGPSQIANNAVDLTSKVTGTLPTANGGTGSTSATFVNNTNTNSTLITSQTEKTSLVDTDKFLISDSAASGALKFVQNSKIGIMKETGSLYSETGNSTNEMNIDSCFSSAYNMYLVKFQVLPGNNAVGLTMRAKHSTGSMSGSHYDYVSQSRSTAGTDGEHRGTEQTKIILSDAVTSREYDTGAWGEFYIWANTDRSASAAFSCTGRYGVMTSNSGGDTKIYTHVSQYQRTVTDAGALTGLQFYWESGNTAQYNIKVYGLLGSNA